MTKRKKYWLFAAAALVIWIAFIFTRSLQPPDASLLESQWVLDLIRAILPFEPSMNFVRKVAHFVEFAVLGVLAGLLFGGWCKSFRRTLLFALLVGACIALCDEMIQFFISGRDGKPQDVCLDITGSAFGVLATLAVKSLCFKRKKKGQPKSRKRRL